MYLCFLLLIHLKVFYALSALSKMKVILNDLVIPLQHISYRQGQGLGMTAA